MTDDLLDEATRLVEGDEPYTEENIDRVLLALCGRVQRVERELYGAKYQRDAARGKLDKVRERVAGAERGVARDVLAILDD